MEREHLVQTQPPNREQLNQEQQVNQEPLNRELILILQHLETLIMEVEVDLEVSEAEAVSEAEEDLAAEAAEVVEVNLEYKHVKLIAKK